MLHVEIILNILNYIFVFKKIKPYTMFWRMEEFNFKNMLL